MTRVLPVFVFAFFIFSGFAQTLGIIECNGRTSVSSWEAPDSIMVVEQLACGQKVMVLGMEKNYVKIQIRGNVFAYVEAEYVRFTEDVVPE